MNDEITRREALKQGAIFGGAALVWVRPSVQSFGMSATLAAQASGSAGCTPGFWKTNPGRALTVGGVDIENAYIKDYFATDFTEKYIDALGYKGGNGIDGAARILLRAAAAGYLNAALSGYAYTQGQLVGLVDSALGSDDRDTMLALASQIDLENNQGCPLSADESEIKGPKDEEPVTGSDQVFGVEGGDDE